MTVFTLMTAMPPTKGHLEMIKFASKIGTERHQDVKVILHTQPGEPYIHHRSMALLKATRNMPNVKVWGFHQETEDDPETIGFREFWRDVMVNQYQFARGDILVTSETYGNWLAEICGGIHIPFDPDRALIRSRATDIRGEHGLAKHFDRILPEFQEYLIRTITVFGAESVGKSTFSKELSAIGNAHWLHEYARPYLETVGTEITTEAMRNIWLGQKVSQMMANEWRDRPFVIQDTDLFSTVGYWNLPHWADSLGEVPPGLIDDAKLWRSDLYIVLRSNIEFEADPLRYGGNVRESDDQYWIDLCVKYDLNYVVIDETDPIKRIGEGLMLMKNMLKESQDRLTYDRGGY